MIRKVILTALIGLAFGTVPSAAQTTDEQTPLCYECKVGGPGYMDCWTGANPGHISCIPYATTCSVGAPCGSAFRTLQIKPDGSFDTGMPGLTVTEVGLIASIERNCLGLITGRQYDAGMNERIRSSTATIIL